MNMLTTLSKKCYINLLYIHANKMPFRRIPFLIVDLLIKIKTFVTYNVDSNERQKSSKTQLTCLF